MKNKHGTTPHYKNILLISLADLNTAGRAETAEAAELLLQAVTFLARYSFLLEPATEEADFLKPKNAPAGEIHAQNAYVARYLDPKYSRWISVDPALGEYIPAAGKGNSENAGNLPGMGGIYNHINGDLYHYAGNNPVRYMDSDGRNDEDVVREMIYDALNFIIENIEEDDDFLIANKLREMMNNGKIQIDDVRKRYETFEKKGHEDNCLGFFDPWRNTVIGERRNIIVIDIKNALKFGLGELIDTLMHEGCHAVQSDIGFITVDESNNKYVKNSDAYIEHMAYNIGFRMYNKFAKQNKLEPKHYFTYDDVVKILKRGNEK